jgi:methionyl-tRNA formyltransferase|tara:strand:+ start:1655 stop:2302 length:648 start_codon:yes stop_codon:yes gene_type:complete
MKIQILLDKNSWGQEYKDIIIKKLKKFTKKIIILNNHTKLKKKFTICLVFSYFKKIPSKYLGYSMFNLITHESNLPKGMGMSPLTWQILAGRKIITFSLIEASNKIDRGKIYFKKKVNFNKNLLFKEIKKVQFDNNINLIFKFLNYYKKHNKSPKSYTPKGKPSYYKLRNETDSLVDINKNIKSQFDLLRSVDNKKYPAFFYYKKRKYYLRVDDK